MPREDLSQTIHAYLDAFARRDLDQCLEFYAESSILNFQSGLYEGKPSIADWHKDRFEVDLRVLTLDRMVVEDDSARVDVTVSSKRLQAWKIGSVSATIALEFQDGKIKAVQFSPRLVNPIDLIRSSS